MMPGIPSPHSTAPWTAAAADSTRPRVEHPARQTSARAFRAAHAGINAGRDSPFTITTSTPRPPGPRSSGCGRRPKAAALSSPHGCRSIRSTSPSDGSTRTSCLRSCGVPMHSAWCGRTRGHRARQVASRSSSGRTRSRSTQPTSSARRRSFAFPRTRRGAARVFGGGCGQAGDGAATRHLRRSRTPVHERLLLQVRFCAFSKGKLRDLRGLLSRPAGGIVRRCEEPGAGGDEVCCSAGSIWLRRRY